MSKQQRDAIDAAMRAEPFDLSQSTGEHRKSFEALALVVPATILLANVISIGPAVTAMRTHPASVLREE
jgi:hypothetical protein